MTFDFSHFRVVVVTGCQRSGTTIASHIIADESGFEYIDERRYGTSTACKDGWLYLVRKSQDAVIQSPAMSRWTHEAGQLNDVLIVWMLRPLEEIIASAERIRWNGYHHQVERDKYDAGDDPRHIAEIKLDYWRDIQCAQVINAFELQYECLAAHPLWVPKDKRTRFGPRQWKI